MASNRQTDQRTATPAANRGSLTVTSTEAGPSTPFNLSSGTLRLRAVQPETTEQQPRVQWAEDVIDNEGMGRKSSKGNHNMMNWNVLLVLICYPQCAASTTSLERLANPPTSLLPIPLLRQTMPIVDLTRVARSLSSGARSDITNITTPMITTTTTAMQMLPTRAAVTWRAKARHKLGVPALTRMKECQSERSPKSETPGGRRHWLSTKFLHGMIPIYP